MFSLGFKDVYIREWFSVGGPIEKDSNIRHANLYLNDYYYGCKTIEDAESKMINTVVKNLSIHNYIDLIIGGNLSNQLSIMNYALKNNNIPFLGLYNACATFTEGMIVASNLLNRKSNICVITSSHTLTAEKQFRFPIEYEGLKKNYSTETITASVGIILSKEKSKYRVTCATIGDVVDYDITDVYHMGAVMAPSCAKTIANHVKNFKKNIKEYDLILTGDLGLVGIKILNKLLKNDYKLVSENIYDAGSIIYKSNQEKNAGGSGPAVLPFVFFNKFIGDKKYKKILLVGTGALHSPTIVNQKKSIPSIAHAIEIEVLYD